MAKKSTGSVQQLSFGLIILDPDAHRQEMKRKGRKCLSCARTFQSTGPGNRICCKCKDLDSWTTPVSYAVHAAF
jgi:hypothetical protein